MRNYSRKKSTPNKVSYRTPTPIRNKRIVEDIAVKSRYRRYPAKGRPEY